MTTTYKPGDRFISSGHLTENKTGTIGETTVDGKTILIWDHSGPHTWSAESIEAYIKPAPIKVGDTVRIVGPIEQTRVKYDGLTAKVVRIEFGLVETECFGDGTTCTLWSIENLRAVAPDQPTSTVERDQQLLIANLTEQINIKDGAIKQAAKIMRNCRLDHSGMLFMIYEGAPAAEWLAANAPRHEFKRGDRVEYIGNDSAVETGTRGRIVSETAPHHDVIEVMFYMRKGDTPKFVNVSRRELQPAP